MSTRIPAAWVVVLLVVGVFAFFGYHIVQAASTEDAQPKTGHLLHGRRMQHADDVYNEDIAPSHPPQPPYIRNAPQGHSEDEQAPANARPVPAPNRMPTVPAQTEEDLRAPEPLQATPPTTQYDLPEAIDPMNRMVHSDAEFGTNFRHPEQMIERRPAAGMAGVIPSGLGSAESHPGGNNPQMYTPEMAQNGGEFMSGIHAFDTSEAGVGYSLL